MLTQNLRFPKLRTTGKKGQGRSPRKEQAISGAKASGTSTKKKSYKAVTLQEVEAGGLETIGGTNVEALIMRNTGRVPTPSDIDLYSADRSKLSEYEKAEYDELHGVEQTVMSSEEDNGEDKTEEERREQRKADEERHKAATAKMQSAAAHRETLLKEEVGRVRKRESTLREEKRTMTEEIETLGSNNRERERQAAVERGELKKELREAREEIASVRQEMREKLAESEKEAQRVRRAADDELKRSRYKEFETISHNRDLMERLKDATFEKEELEEKVRSMEGAARAEEEKRKTAIKERAKLEWEASARARAREVEIQRLSHEMILLQHQLGGITEDLATAQNDKHKLLMEKSAMEVRVENWEALAQNVFRLHPEVEPAWTELFGAEFDRIRQVRRALEDNNGRFTPDAQGDGDSEAVASHTLDSIGRHQRMSAYLTSEALEHMIGVAQATQQNYHSMALQFLQLQTGVNETLRVLGGRQVLLNNIHNRYSPGERLNQEGKELESPETEEARKDLRQKVGTAPATMLPDLAQVIYDLLDSSSTFPSERRPKLPVGKGRYNTSIDGTILKGPFAEGKDSEPRQHQGSSASSENRGTSAQKRGRALGDGEETVDARAGAKEEREGPTEKDEERKKSQRTEGPEKGENHLGPSEDDGPEGTRVERPRGGAGESEGSREGSDGYSSPPEPHTGQGKEDNQPAPSLDEPDGDSVPDIYHPLSDDYHPVHEENVARSGLGLDLYYPESKEETPDKTGDNLSEKEDEPLPSQIRGATGESEVIDLRTQPTPRTQGAPDNLQSPTPSQADGTRVSGRIKKPTDRFADKSYTQ